jgi:DNA-binding response OmpR family regulator
VRRGQAAAPGPPAAPGEDAAADFTGVRVLLVEDEFFVAVHLEETLHAFGCATVGPFATLELAQQAVRRETVGFAILDINLSGRPAFPLAEQLAAAGIPFLFLTGYARADLPERYRTLPRLQKPVDPSELRRAMAAALRRC